MEKANRKPPASAVRLVVILLVCAGLAFAGLKLIPRHPTPEYAVDSYEKLAKKLGGVGILPPRELLPDSGCHYMVLLESRFTDRAAGYLIGFSAEEDGTGDISITCKALRTLPEESRRIRSDASYRGTELFRGKDHVCFILDGFRYDLHCSEAVSGITMTIAQSIIDAHE